MIRMATSADAFDLAALHVLTWQQAYAGLMPAPFLKGLELELETRCKQWKQAISDNLVSVLLDLDEDTFVGFAACGKSLDNDADSTWGELGALYYLEQYWGAGRAQALLHETLEQLKANGSSIATLWVLDNNSQAISFYKKHGFRFDAQEKVEQQTGFSIRELRMHKRLTT